MKILLLGATGQLGSDLLRAAEERGTFEVTPWSRRDLDVAHVESIEGALAEQDFEVLINCASYHKTDEVESNAQLAFTVNAHAVQAMAEACRRKNVRLVHFSTDYVFDGGQRHPYREEDAPAALNVYGTSKLMGEALIRTTHDDALIFRVASLFGIAGSQGKGGNFVETIIRRGREAGTLRVVNDQVMSPTATPDVARVVLEAIAKGIPAGTYHAVNSGQAWWYEFAGRIIDRAGVPATVEPIPTTEYPVPARRPTYSVLDNSRLCDAVGPMAPWREALDRYLEAKGHRAAQEKRASRPASRC